MSGRYAILVGLSSVDPDAYGGWDGRRGCAGAETDVDFMAQLLRDEGYAPQDIVTLKTEQATAGAVLTALRERVRRIGEGDLVVFFYSGHGGQLADLNRDEANDGLDETLCLFDRQVVDDEIGAIWSELPVGAYGLMISDACNSGTNAKAAREGRRLSPFIVRERPTKGRGGELLQIGAARDGQDAIGLVRGGLFTLALARVAAAGLPAGYRVLRERIVQEVQAIDRWALQEVQLVAWQGAGAAFEASRPFSRPGGGGAQEARVVDPLDHLLLELDEDTATNPDVDAVEVRSESWRVEGRIAEGQARMRAREAAAGKRFTGGVRDPRTVTGVVLHQTGFARGPDPADYFGVTAHFIVAPGGRTAQLHPIERVLYAANEFNATTVSIEFIGNFRSVRDRWWPKQKPNFLAKAQVESGKRLLRALKEAYPQLRYVYGHIQSKGIDRGNDPGPDLWCTVGRYAIDQLGYLEDREIHEQYGGLPIPDAWRTWTPKLI